MKFENILIVEDNKEQAMELKAMLKSLLPDVQSFVANCYYDAVKMLRQEEFHCFFLDIMLSEQPDHASADGISLGKQIRCIPRYVNTPIIYLTSYSNRMQEAINEIHCYGFLYKPYNFEELKRMLRSMNCHEKTEQLSLRLESSVFVQLELSDIQYIKSDGKYMLYHTQKGIYRSRQYKMSQLQEMYPGTFCRCHKSYMFNERFFECYDSVNQCVRLIQCVDIVPVGRKYYDLPIYGRALGKE